MATQQVQCFFLGSLWVLSDSIRGCVTFILIADDFFPALIEVDIEENKLLDPWHIEDTLEIKINFLSFVSKVFVREVSQVCHLF